MVYESPNADVTPSAPLLPGGNVQELYGGYENYSKGGDDKSQPASVAYAYQPQYDVEAQPGLYYEQPVVYYWYNVGLPVGHTERNRFMAKVMGAVLLQLLITVAVSLPVLISSDSAMNQAFRENWWIYLVGWMSSIVVLIFLAIFRKTPGVNLALLCLFSLAISVSVASVVVYYSVYQVIEAFCITVCIVLSLTVFILVAKVDMTMVGAALIMFGCFLLWWMLFWWLITPAWYNVTCVGTDADHYFCYYSSPPGASVWTQIWIGLGVVIFTGYLIFDLSRLQQTCHTDEWAIAAANIYVDVIMLFLLLLALGKK